MSYTRERGWKNARFAYYDVGISEYIPVACVTSLDENLSVETQEHTNTCTQGVTTREVKRVVTVLTLNAETTSANSLAELEALQNSKIAHYFKREGHSSTSYYKATIGNISTSDVAGELSTFTCRLDVEEEFDVDPKAESGGE